MKAWHQRNLLDPEFPFDLFISENTQFPPHWHGELEIVYLLEGQVQVSLNSEIYHLKPKDILLIGVGDVHSFLTPMEKCRMIIVQFGLSILEYSSVSFCEKRFMSPLLDCSLSVRNKLLQEVHNSVETEILGMAKEYEEKAQAYKMALKARLFQLMVIILRGVPMEKYSDQERNNRLNRLDRLEKVFQYVEGHLDETIRISEVAQVANFSIFHFTRFFKASTGMTFGEYVNSYRIQQAEWYLTSTEDSITEIAFKVGFNSIQTFDRVFKNYKGCSPKEFRRAIFAK